MLCAYFIQYFYCIFKSRGIYFPSTPTTVDARDILRLGDSKMYEYVSPLYPPPLVVTGKTPGNASGLTLPGPSQSTEVTEDTVKTFLLRAEERARALQPGMTFSLVFSEGSPNSERIMHLLRQVERLAPTFGLRFCRCSGWEFSFKKLHSAMP